MRLLFLILLLANFLAFAYIRYAESRAGADAQIALLQISPDKLKLLPPQTRDKTANARSSSAPPAATAACLEWGGFAAEEAPRAAAALAQFDLGDKLSQREVSDAGWWVYVPPFKTKAEADRKAGEVKALGIGDVYVMQDSSPWRFALALGAFKTEDAARNYLAQLRKKGLPGATAGPRGAAASFFVIRDPGDAIAAKIAGLKTEFPAAGLKATACAEPVAAKNQ